MNAFDLRHPFFLPLWRRALVVGVSFAWAIVELITGSPGWAILFAGAGGVCAYQFFVRFDPKDYAPKEKKP
jgi:hypothetical protein